jgi:hypothetical protein
LWGCGDLDNQITNRSDQVSSEAVEILFRTYVGLVKKNAPYVRQVPPHINALHEAFQAAFFTEMVDFLYANGELEDKHDLGSMADFLLSHDLPVPSEIQMHAALHHFGISFISRNNQLINGSVIPVW